MRTLVLEDPEEAARMLRQGAIVAVPTETVYGLAARFDLPEAVARIFRAKGRPADNPLIVHLGSVEWLPRVAATVPPTARQLLERFAPGPLTVTVPRGPEVPSLVTAGLENVAVRVPAEERIQRVLGVLGIPIVAPSANRSGRPSPTTWRMALRELEGRIDAVLIGPPARVGIESTVVDCCSDPPVLLRPGGVALEQLAEVVPGIETLSGRPEALARAASPGLRHRHYSPRARVRMFEDPSEVPAEGSAAFLGLDPHPSAHRFAMYRVFASVTEYAAALFAAFQDADAGGVQVIYCQRVALEGIGRGLMDRLERAAEG